MVRVIPAQIVFDMHDRHGLPLDATFAVLYSRKMLCNLRELTAICVERGWNRRRAESRIRDAWNDVYPTDRSAFVRWANG